MLLVGVSLIPIGKLFYLPIESLASVKAAFIFTAVVSSFSLLISFIRGVDRFAFVPIIFGIPALCSLIFLTSTGQGVFTMAAGDEGSTLLRMLSVFITSVYCAYIIVHVSDSETGKKDIATYYVLATLFATFIGGFIFYGIFEGQLSASDILPVSVQEVHINGRVYRFNPGANVNEFGQIVGYALIMLRWTGWRTVWKVGAAIALVTAEFLSLTRGAWVGLIVAYFFYALLTEGRQRMRLLTVGGIAISLVVIVALNVESLTTLLLSRTSLVAGPGGDDRLNTTATVLRGLEISPFRMFFGYGWATNGSLGNGFEGIDIHNVPLAVLFYTGITGFLAYFCIIATIGRFIYMNARADLDIIVALMGFMFTVSLFEHNFYHVQTWLIVGLVMGIALRCMRNRQSGLHPVQLTRT